MYKHKGFFCLNSFCRSTEATSTFIPSPPITELQCRVQLFFWATFVQLSLWPSLQDPHTEHPFYLHVHIKNCTILQHCSVEHWLARGCTTSWSLLNTKAFSRTQATRELQCSEISRSASAMKISLTEWYKNRLTFTLWWIPHSVNICNLHEVINESKIHVYW